MATRTAGNKLGLFINAASFVISSYGLSSVLVLQLPGNLAKAGHWQFLTNISLVLSLGIFLLGTIAHITKSEDLYRIRNLIHPIVLAFESVVSIVYWPLRIFWLPMLIGDRTRLIPLGIDLAIHFVPFVSLALDLFLCMPRWTIKVETALLACIASTFSYWIHLNRIVDIEDGATYPYEFLNVDSDLTRALIFGFVGCIGFLMFLLIRNLYDYLVHRVCELEEKEQ